MKHPATSFRTLKLLCTVSLAAASILASPAQAQESHNKWEGHIEAEGKWGNERSIGEGAIFAPIWQDDDSLFFTDIRTRFDNHDSQEYNFGLGYRQIINDKWIIGGYGFYDRRRTENDNMFNQATLGLEALSENFEARTNMYIPESDEKDIAEAIGFVGSVSGAQLQIQNIGAPTERALPGFDAELGAGFDLPKGWKFWAYAGGYYFDADHYDTVAGPRGRLELSYDDLPYLGENSRFTLGVEAQNDSVRDEQAFAIARLRIPFSAFTQNKASSNNSALEKRMTARVVRDVDIVSGEKAAEVLSTENANVTTANGAQVNSYTTIKAGDNVTAMISAAGQDALIILDGTDGAIDTNTTIDVTSGQTIASGGYVINAVGANSGANVQITLPGRRATIVNNSANDTFDMGDDSALISVDTSGGGTSILVGVDNALIEDVTISDTGSHGILLINGTATTLRNVRIIDTNNDGLSMINSDATVDGLDIDGTLRSGVFMNNSTLNITGADIRNTGERGVSTTNNSTLSLNDSTIRDTGLDAVRVGSTTLSGSGNIISGAVGGVDCSNIGGNTGSISFDDIRGNGAGTCP